MDGLTIVVLVLVIAWICGFGVFHVGSGLIHLLLVIALFVFIVRVLQQRIK